MLELTILLAVAGAAILLVTNLALFVAAGLLAIGYMVLRDNVRELRRARG
jgi:amino acid transporter